MVSVPKVSLGMEMIAHTMLETKIRKAIRRIGRKIRCVSANEDANEEIVENV